MSQSFNCHCEERKKPVVLFEIGKMDVTGVREDKKGKALFLELF